MTFVIAEAGTGHAAELVESRYFKARDLVLAAKEAGADAVKFQLFVEGEPLFCPLDGDDKRWARWMATTMSLHDWKRLREFAREQKIDFSVSVFQKGGLELAKQLDLGWIKVASRAAKTFPYGEWDKGFVISAGLYWPTPAIVSHIVLKCIQEYPCPLEKSWWDCLGGTDGLSDHSGTPWPAIAAITDGAKAVEVHFAINKEGPDAEVSLSTADLALICRARDEIAPLREGESERWPFA